MKQTLIKALGGYTEADLDLLFGRLDRYQRKIETLTKCLNDTEDAYMKLYSQTQITKKKKNVRRKNKA